MKGVLVTIIRERPSRLERVAPFESDIRLEEIGDILDEYATMKEFIRKQRLLREYHRFVAEIDERGEAD